MRLANGMVRRRNARLGDSPPGNEFVSCLGYTARRPIGRATGGSAGNETHRDFCLFHDAKRRRQRLEEISQMELHAIGIDLGKTVFHLVGLDSSGKVVVRKRCSRTQLLAYTANVCVQVIGMEARRGSHFLGRALRTQGHDVRLMPAQYVKPYVKTNKSDYIDTKVIAEAVARPTILDCHTEAPFWERLANRD
jgi:hypothetical protein